MQASFIDIQVKECSYILFWPLEVQAMYSLIGYVVEYL